MHQMVDVSEFDNGYRPDLQLYHEICQGNSLILIIVGPGPTVLAVGAGGVCLDIVSFVYQFSLLSPSLWETARYRLKYCLKGSLSQKQLTLILIV